MLTLVAIRARVQVEPTTGCWLWCGAVSTQGFGRVAGGYVHRKALELRLGRELRPGMVAAHSDACVSLGRVGRTCANPAHLREASQVENAEDRERTAVQRRRQRVMGGVSLLPHDPGHRSKRALQPPGGNRGQERRR